MRHEKMHLDDLQEVADQADKEEVVVISLIGGEELIWEDFEQIIEIIDPTRFLINITTNGSLLDEDMAKHLKDIGLSKVNVSIDSFLEDEHDSFRNHEGSYKKAMQAVKNVIDVGLNLQISTVVTHQNIREEGFQGMLKFSHDNNIQLDIQVATPTGNWQRRKAHLFSSALFLPFLFF